MYSNRVYLIDLNLGLNTKSVFKIRFRHHAAARGFRPSRSDGGIDTYLMQAHDRHRAMVADSRPAYGRLRTLSWQLRSTVAASGATVPPPPAPGHTSSYEHPVVGEAVGGRHLPVLIANGAADGPRFRRGPCCYSRRSSAGNL